MCVFTTSPERRSWRHWPALILLATGLNCPAWAAGIVSRDAPIDIEADRAELQETISTYSGNVRVVQGDVEMTGDVLTVRRNADDNFILTLSGQPARISQAVEMNGQQPITGTATRIDYTSGNETLELKGNATIYRGNEKIAGGDILYDFNNRRTVVNQHGSDNRVKITLQPTEHDKDEP